MDNKTLNQKINQHLDLIEQKKALEKALNASKDLLMGFNGISTDKYAVVVAVTPTERVVGKTDLFAILGEEKARKLELLKQGESKSLKISVR